MIITIEMPHMNRWHRDFQKVSCIRKSCDMIIKINMNPPGTRVTREVHHARTSESWEDIGEARKESKLRITGQILRGDITDHWENL